MRAFAFAVTVVLALTIVPALASANQFHGGCGTSDRSISRTVGTTSVGVDLWTTQCTGATVWFSSPTIFCLGEDVHTPNVLGIVSHTLIIYGCQTGELIQPAL